MESKWTFCWTLALLCSVLAVTDGAKWSYSGHAGPKYWHELFEHQCSGIKQSPIDIKAEQTIYDPTLKDFAIWYDPPKPESKILVKNNGHALQVDLEGEFYVTNGGLPNVYKAAQFHFHWGHKAHHGSEHLMDGVASPIEMHLVTYNSDLYNHIGEAVQEQNGLAVLGVMFEISEEDNPAFESIVKSIKFVRDPEAKLRINLPLDTVSIRNMLPADISRYYRYSGSLTTPGCFESVVWTVFEQKQTISHAQLKEFRSLLQLRRQHHHHKHSEGEATATHERHRRSLSKEERRLENHAMDALLELGIKGNVKEEAYLRAATLKHSERLMQADQPVPAPADSGITVEVKAVDEKVVNDVATEVQGQQNAVSEQPKYVQEQLVNNYRPVQALNDRVVRRSFKLRGPPVLAQDGATAASGRYTVNVNDAVKGDGKGDCDGATSVWASVLVVLASLMLSMFFVL